MREDGWKERVRALLKSGGLTMKAASLAAGQGETFVRDILERDRSPSIENFSALARTLGTSVSDLLAEEGPHAGEGSVIAIMGYIGAGAEIDPDFEQVPPDGLDQVALPFAVPEEMIGFQVRGDSMLPKYDDGDVVVVPREQRRATESMIGEDAAVRTADNRRFLKRIMPGSKRNTFNLESTNARTIVAARIAWASEVWVIVPAGRLRKIAKRAREGGGRSAGKGR